MSAIRPHSSDGEQPHCRRTRADSSPAAGTNSQFAATTPGDKPASACMPPAPTDAGHSFSFVSAEHDDETTAAVRVQARQIAGAADNQSHRLHKNHANSATGTRSSSHNNSMGQS